MVSKLDMFFRQNIRLWIVAIACWFSLTLTGCEDVDLMLATEAGVDAVKSITLSEEAVQRMAKQSSAYVDRKQRVAGPGNQYAIRLRRLVGEHQQEGSLSFNYKVYLSPQVNAFAMADGTIRIYSGLMDMMNDGELRFVIGHEMGHVAQKHIHKKIKVAYGASAIRKAVGSIDGVAGEIARSQLGGFVQSLTSAQFSQYEEKEADDYGLSFMKLKGYNPWDSVAALKKLAGLGNNHSFLSSHPDPGKRAERLKLQLEGKAPSIQEKKEGLLDRLRTVASTVYNKILKLVAWLINLF